MASSKSDNVSETFKDLPTHTSVTEVHGFLGMVTYCSHFIPDFATTSQPLRELTKNTAMVLGTTAASLLGQIENSTDAT